MTVIVRINKRVLKAWARRVIRKNQKVFDALRDVDKESQRK